METSPVFHYQKRKYESLDLWRGFLAIWLVLFHSFSSIQHDMPREIGKNLFLAFCNQGGIRIPLFFVISGYCIAVAATNILDRKQSAWQFIESRVRRIFPPYWTALLLAIVFSGFAYTAQQRGIIHNSHLAERFTLLTSDMIATNAALIQIPLQQDSINVVTWTLNYEIAFYIVVAIALFLHRKQDSRQMIKGLHLVTVVVAFVVAFAPRLALFPFNLWTSFGVGILLFDVLCGQPWNKRSAKGKLFYGGLITAISVLVLLFVALNWKDEWARQNVIVLPFAILLYALHRFDKKIVQTTLFRGLFAVGQFSYSLYLTHYLILGILRQLAKRLQVSARFCVVEMVIELAVCLTVAFIFYRLVEVPLMSSNVASTLVSKRCTSDETRRGWIGVDLDGTLAFSEKWRGVEYIGPPITAMRERVAGWLSQGYDIRIFTARVASLYNPAATKAERLQAQKALWAIEDWCQHHFGTNLPVTAVKDFDMQVLYDDRCISVEKNTGRLTDGTDDDMQTIMNLGCLDPIELEVNSPILPNNAWHHFVNQTCYFFRLSFPKPVPSTKIQGM